jgi:hypothetical protein
VDQVPSKYVDIWPFSSSKRPIDPNNITSLDTDGYFVSKRSMFDFVRKKLFVAFVWSLTRDLEVCTINCYLACLSSISFESVVPLNLVEREVSA